MFVYHIFQGQGKGKPCAFPQTAFFFHLLHTIFHKEKHHLDLAFRESADRKAFPMCGGMKVGSGKAERSMDREKSVDVCFCGSLWIEKFFS